jgi:hypothetical protein
MAKVRPRRLVIDTDVCSKAGDRSGGDSLACLEFLTAVRQTGHSTVMTPALWDEWNRRRSRWAYIWLKSMYAARRVVELDLAPDAAVRAAVERGAPERSIADILLKDCHLIEAALATDRRVVSGEKRSRYHFGQLAARMKSLREVCWVNPTIADEQPLDWLRRGAPLDRHRLLGAPVRLTPRE